MNTTETNKKLAEFLGWEQFGNVGLYGTTFHNNKGSLKWLTKDMKFHNDWNWLMLVVEKIKESCWMDISIGTSATVEIGKYNQQEPNIASHNARSMVEAVYNACSMFVDWYNGAQKRIKIKTIKRLENYESRSKTKRR